MKDIIGISLAEKKTSNFSNFLHSNSYELVEFCGRSLIECEQNTVAIDNWLDHGTQIQLGWTGPTIGRREPYCFSEYVGGMGRNDYNIFPITGI